jgi:hypothetical protein
MTLASISEAIQNTDFFTAVRESALVYPIVLSTHLTCIAIFGGLILMTNFRLLGWALQSVPFADMLRQTRIWKGVGLTIMLMCGVLLGGAKLSSYYDNPYFDIKLTLLFLILVHSFVFHRSVYGNATQLDQLPKMPRVAKVAAATSLILWLGVMSCGRWIAYFERPEEHPKRTTPFELPAAPR